MHLSSSKWWLQFRLVHKAGLSSAPSTPLSDSVPPVVQKEWQFSAPYLATEISSLVLDFGIASRKKSSHLSLPPQGSEISGTLFPKWDCPMILFSPFILPSSIVMQQAKCRELEGQENSQELQKGSSATVVPRHGPLFSQGNEFRVWTVCCNLCIPPQLLGLFWRHLQKIRLILFSQPDWTSFSNQGLFRSYPHASYSLPQTCFSKGKNSMVPALFFKGFLSHFVKNLTSFRTLLLNRKIWAPLGILDDDDEKWGSWLLCELWPKR